MSARTAKGEPPKYTCKKTYLLQLGLTNHCNYMLTIYS